MNKKQNKHPLEWFTGRIGKNIYRRNTNICQCEICQKTEFFINNEMMAKYYFSIQNQMLTEYFNSKAEILEI